MQRAQTQTELDALRRPVCRGQPYAAEPVPTNHRATAAPVARPPTRTSRQAYLTLRHGL
ncbi:MAG: hypothetical protein JW829_19395 [Pirellulales bacterium]|nr:hypothetical protein [Pirellulales bacterium]